jgi:hypothetical protein
MTIGRGTSPFGATNWEDSGLSTPPRGDSHVLYTQVPGTVYTHEMLSSLLQIQYVPGGRDPWSHFTDVEQKCSKGKGVAHSQTVLQRLQ